MLPGAADYSVESIMFTHMKENCHARRRRRGRFFSIGTMGKPLYTGTREGGREGGECSRSSRNARKKLADRIFDYK